MLAVLFPNKSHVYNLFSEIQVLGEPLLVFQLQWLDKQAEVDTIIVADDKPEMTGEKVQKNIIYIGKKAQENLAFLKEYLRDEPFFLILGNIITDAPLAQLYNEYIARRADLAFFYGDKDKTAKEGYFIKLDKAHKLRDFKYNNSVYNQIFQHIYLISSELLEYIGEEPDYNFYERFLPDMLKRNKFIQGTKSKSFWLDPVEPASWYKLNYQMLRENWELSGSKINNVYFGQKCDIDFSVELSGEQFFGENCLVKKESRVTGSLLFNNVKIGQNTFIKNSILCNNVIIGDNCQIENVILGENTVLEEQSELKNTVISQNSLIKRGSLNLNV